MFRSSAEISASVGHFVFSVQKISFTATSAVIQFDHAVKSATGNLKTFTSEGV